MRVWAIAALCLAAPGAAMGQTMEFGCPAPGTKISRSDGSMTVGKQEGFFCKVEDSARGSGELYALMYYFNPERRRDPTVAKYISPIAVERIWPLSVGKRHKGQVDLSGTTFFLEYAVTGMEVVATPMGPQNTFVVELKETSLAGYQATQKWWISPSLKMSVKSDFSNNRGVKASIPVTGVSR